ncbi:MAG: hypothetical protein ABIH76_09155 [Candidatus Bathyarchaeota archaeon]
MPMKFGSGEKKKERKIFELLKDESYRRIFDACGTKSANEVAKITSLDPSECAEKLETLERNGIIIYTGDKWKTTEHSLGVRKKYWPTG